MSGSWRKEQSRGETSPGLARLAAHLPAALLAAIGIIALASLADAQQDELQGLPVPFSDAPREAPVDSDPLALGAAPELVGDEQDTALRQRLEAIFSNLSELQAVTVDVGTGVVRLSGPVPSLEARQQAAQIARRQEGVLAVDNQTRVVRSLRQLMSPVRERLEGRLLDVVALLPLVVVALVILLVFWGVARSIGKWPAPFRRLAGNRFIGDLVRQVAQTVVFVVGLLLALEVLGAVALVGAVLGTAGLVGLALGFAFRDMAENYIASILLSLRQPFAPGEHVVIEGQEGKVMRLTSRATLLMTLDGNSLRIPNAKVFKGTILNYSRNPLRQLAVRAAVGFGEDLVEVQRIGARALSALPGVVSDPPAFARIEAMAESSISVGFFGWVDQTVVDFLKVQSEATRVIKEALEVAGVGAPEPALRVLLRRQERLHEEDVPQRAVREAAPADLAPDHHLDQQIAREREQSSGEDLLRKGGALE